MIFIALLMIIALISWVFVPLERAFQSCQHTSRTGQRCDYCGITYVKKGFQHK